MMTLFEQAAQLLASGQSFAYATIISENGSTPRSVGAKMLILPDRIYETIGGGGVEGDVIRLARERVLSDHQPRIKRYDMTGADAANSDFICGGTGEVLIDYIDAQDADNLTIFEQAAQAALCGQNAWLVTILDENREASSPRQFFLVLAGGQVVGTFHETPYLDKIAVCSPLAGSLHGEVRPGVRCIFDAVHIGGTVYLFGAGHVSKEVATMAKMAGFHVVVLDDRVEFANAERFPGCEVRVIDSFEHMPLFAIDANSYLLIITRGHLFDRVVLEWALTTEAGYIGMIGSRSKREAIYGYLRGEGVAQARLDEVHSPIGLAIGAETPAEIAVSIVAELIQERARARKTQKSAAQQQQQHEGGRL